MKSLSQHRSTYLVLTILSLQLVSLPKIANGANILFFMGLATHSHRVALQPLAVKLADTGHNVTFLTYMKSENPHPNITEFFPEEAKSLMEGQIDDISGESVRRRLKERYYDPILAPNFLQEFQVPGLKTTFLNEGFKEWLKSVTFDLIIYDQPFKEIANGIAYKIKSKVIAFQTTAIPYMADFDLLGLPSESSWLPDWSAGSDYTFIPRHFHNAYNALSGYFAYKWYFLPKVDEILAQLFGEQLPPIEQLVKKVDVTFVNEHFSSTFARSLPPFVIPVGGMHCKESKGDLPKDIEAFLKTKERFVFVSFGSAVKISALPLENQRMLFKTVESIENTNFLWKWEGDIPKILPKNVFAKNWFPQQDVLAHPKCKGFVTQGGGISFQQATFHGVPMIVIPIWADQGFVAHCVTHQGNGIHLELADVNQETFTNALTEILDNEKYYSTATAISKRFKDRPMPPVDTAAWWVEYVLRHDTSHLKSPAIQQYWWQRRLLDFWATVLSLMLLALFVAIRFCIMLVKLASGLAEKSTPHKDKKQ